MLHHVSTTTTETPQSKKQRTFHHSISDHSRSFNLPTYGSQAGSAASTQNPRQNSDIDQEVVAPSSVFLRESQGSGAHDLAKTLLVLFTEGVVREDGEVVEIVLFGGEVDPVRVNRVSGCSCGQRKGGMGWDGGA